MNPNDLKQFSPLRDLSAEELEQLIPFLEERLLAPGGRVLTEGQDAHGLVLLIHGSLKVASDAGYEGTIKAPASLGAAALATLGTRAMTAVAEEPCAIQVLPRTAFHRFAEDAPRAAIRILEAIVADLAMLLRQRLDDELTPVSLEGPIADN